MFYPGEYGGNTKISSYYVLLFSQFYLSYVSLQWKKYCSCLKLLFTQINLNCIIKRFINNCTLSLLDASLSIIIYIVVSLSSYWIISFCCTSYYFSSWITFLFYIKVMWRIKISIINVNNYKLWLNEMWY